MPSPQWMASWLTETHVQAERTLESILEAKLLYQKHTQQMEPLLGETIDAETLQTAQAALYTLLEHRNNLEANSAKALEQHLSKVAQTHPERLLAGILHEDLQVRAYIARALRANDIILDPWGSQNDRKLMMEKPSKMLNISG